MLTIKEEGGCELYNMYKNTMEMPYKKEYVLHIGDDEVIYIDFDNREVLVNGVRIFKDEDIK